MTMPKARPLKPSLKSLRSICGWLAFTGFIGFLAGAHSQTFLIFVVLIPFAVWLLAGTPLIAIVLGLWAGFS